MNSALHAELGGWANFYLVTASGAAALTGLQFVVQTLLASDALRGVAGADPEGGIAAFGTPTVVHFSIAMLVSSVLCAPWPGYAALQVALTLLGAGALIYAAIVLRRTRRQRGYKATAYDFTWHVGFPALAYAGVLTSALEVGENNHWPFFVIAGSVLLLLCTGIHNSWDTVTYLTLQSLRGDADADAQATDPSDA